jgi:signal transduction histidine kinase
VNRNLKIANAKAKEAARLKSEFMANMSHELRTPLNAIIGFTGIMLNGFGGELDADAQHMVSRVYENSQNLLSLINSVLDIAKIEAGRMEIVAAPFKIQELVRKWESALSVLAEQKQLRFSTTIDETMPDIIYGDAERLTQITNNLLSNAFKFTQQGEVLLQIKRLKNTWQIIVKDSGIGIPPHALHYIFDEFRQVDGSSTRVYGGSGLGLAITRNLCLMMGGHITVTSTVEVGSTFTVTLPLKLFETDEMKPVSTENAPAKEAL